MKSRREPSYRVGEDNTDWWDLIGVGALLLVKQRTKLPEHQIEEDDCIQERPARTLSILGDIKLISDF